MKTEKEILQTNMTEEARKQGFGHMAFLPVEQLVFVPEYRKYCEQNLCGNYDKLKMCPPKSGTVEEMKEHACQYQTAFIMQTIQALDIGDPDEIKRAKHRHNEMTRGVEEVLKKAGGSIPHHERRPHRDKLLHVRLLRRCGKNGRCLRNGILVKGWEMRLFQRDFVLERNDPYDTSAAALCHCGCGLQLH